MEDRQFQQVMIELIKDLKSDINRRLDEAKEERSQLKADMNRRFEEAKEDRKQIVKMIDRETHEREKMEKKLEKVYEARKQVTVDFSWNYFGVHAFATAVIAFVVSFFTGR